MRSFHHGRRLQQKVESKFHFYCCGLRELKMRITKNEELGVRLVASLARSGGQLTIRELAGAEQVPETTVAKVVARLRRAGLVAAERGRNGGYSLAHPAERITLADVVGAFDSGPFGDHFCARMNSGTVCAHDSDCELRPVWRGLGALVGNFLAGHTVADLVQGRAADRTTARLEQLPVVGTSGG
jgi:Rrf2 family protein